jgi:hypothetical protein
MDDERVMLPEKSNVLVRATAIDEPVASLLKLIGEVTEIVKSPTWTIETAE